MTTKKLIKLLALYLPYILLGLVATNIGEAWRLAEGKELGDKIMSMMGTIPVAFANPLPSLHIPYFTYNHNIRVKAKGRHNKILLRYIQPLIIRRAGKRMHHIVYHLAVLFLDKRKLP